LDLAFSLQEGTGTPLHQQLYEQWREAISSGRFAGGGRVPSTRSLARSLAVSRTTVADAYDQLTAEGYFVARRGSGTYVADDLPEDHLRARAPRLETAESAWSAHLSHYGGRLAANAAHAFDPPQPQRASVLIRPDVSRFPHALWARISARHLRRADRRMLEYSSEPAGYLPLRESVATYLSQSRAVRCDAGRVIITSGSQQALDLCARVLLNADDSVALEDPCYLGARRAFEAQGARLEPTPVDEHGIEIDRIARRARLVYVTPSHQYPTGASLSASRRLALLEWARRANGLILEDDYDSEFRYGGRPLPALQGMAAGARVIYIGTFSKALFPGLRLGYMVVPGSLVRTFTRAKWLNDRQTPHFEQMVVNDFLREGHLLRHIRRMRTLYGTRRERLVALLNRYGGDRLSIVGEPAGMHLMVRIHDGRLLALIREIPEFLSAEPYYLKDSPRNVFLIGFAGASDRALRDLARKLSL
jgi:GntR family transcriptional regulator/MocR family aminotransferase